MGQMQNIKCPTLFRLEVALSLRPLKLLPRFAAGEAATLLVGATTATSVGLPLPPPLPPTLGRASATAAAAAVCGSLPLLPHVAAVCSQLKQTLLIYWL